MGLVDLAHPAGTERGDDFVGTETSSGDEWHGETLSHESLATNRLTARSLFES